MRQTPFLLSLLLLLAAGSPDRSGVRASLPAAAQQPPAETPARKGSANSAAIIAGAVAFVAIAGYFLLKKKPRNR
jgi:LPXTG-motif cell wall-anchored protein